MSRKKTFRLAKVLVIADYPLKDMFFVIDHTHLITGSDKYLNESSSQTTDES